MRVLHYCLIIFLCSTFPALATSHKVTEIAESEWYTARALANELLEERNESKLRTAYDVFCENSTDDEGKKRYEPGSYEDFLYNLPNDVTLGSKKEASLEASYRIGSCTAALFLSALESKEEEIAEMLFDPLVEGLQERTQIEKDEKTATIGLKK